MNFKHVLSFMSAAIPVCGLAAQTEKPNVLMILVDDWGQHDVSYNGSNFYETHNIDQLASKSNVFSQGYVCYPRSVPSRYSFITGRHCAKPQEGSRADERHVGKDDYCIAMPFKNAGYQTYYIGKWHLVDKKEVMPQDKGFDINIGGGHAGSTPTYFAPFNAPAKNRKRMIFGMEDAKEGEYLTDYMSDRVVDFINAKREKPFFAICAYYAVHTPLEAKASIEKKYQKKKRAMGLKADPMIKQEAGVAKTQQDDATYAAMIESVDEGVGRMIESLKKTGQYEKTIIVLVSDHGGLSNRGINNKRRLATTNAPLKAGKGHLYEGGLKVPFLIHMPGQTNSKSYKEPVVSMDLLPTLADLCNAKVDPKADLDGVSLKSLLLSGRQKGLINRELYWHKSAERPTQTGDYVSTAIRQGNYKLIDFYEQNRVELYDLSKDEGETHNLVNEKPDVANALLTKIKKWRKDNRVNMYDAKKERRKATRKAARKAQKRKMRKQNKH